MKLARVQKIESINKEL